MQHDVPPPLHTSVRARRTRKWQGYQLEPFLHALFGAFLVTLLISGCTGEEVTSTTGSRASTSTDTGIIPSVTPTTGDADPRSREAVTIHSAEITHRIIDAPNGTFGYEILSGGQAIILQTSVPGKQGLSGFQTIEEAERVAAVVIEKLKNGEMPPTLSAEELNTIQHH